MKILIVDDNPENLATAQRFFAGQEIEVITADSKIKALNLISTCSMVITDMEMEQDDSGLYVVKQALKKHIPVFVLSGMSLHPECAVPADSHHGNDCIIFPDNQMFFVIPLLKTEERAWEWAWTRIELFLEKHGTVRSDHYRQVADYLVSDDSPWGEKIKKVLF